jgi:hypothetical protein
MGVLISPNAEERKANFVGFLQAASFVHDVLTWPGTSDNVILNEVPIVPDFGVEAGLGEVAKAAKGANSINEAGDVAKAAEATKAATQTVLKTDDIMFAQKSYDPFTFRAESNGQKRLLADTINDLKTNPEKTLSNIPPIQVGVINGNYVSKDTRRLVCYNAAGVEKVPVEIITSESNPGAWGNLMSKYNEKPAGAVWNPQPRGPVKE